MKDLAHLTDQSSVDMTHLRPASPEKEINIGNFKIFGNLMI